MLAARSLLRVLRDLDFLDGASSHAYDNAIVAYTDRLDVELWTAYGCLCFDIPSQVEDFETFE